MEDLNAFEQVKTTEVLSLSAEEISKLDQQKMTLNEFQQNKLQKECAKNWDKFYNRNGTRFFKDRHWTLREFGDLTDLSSKNGHPCVLMEIGCGVGNFLFPFLSDLQALRRCSEPESGVNSYAAPDVFVIACDFSPRAVEQVKHHQQFDSSMCRARVVDITDPELPVSMRCWAQDSLSTSSEENVAEDLPRWLAQQWPDSGPHGGVDIVTLIFVLSALHPSKVPTALKNVSHLLRIGGRLLLRDYGIHDHAQVRFGVRGAKLGERFYTRQDGTFSYFFTLEELEERLKEAGLSVVQQCYVHRPTVNRKEGLAVTRVFVQIVAEKRE